MAGIINANPFHLKKVKQKILFIIGYLLLMYVLYVTLPVNTVITLGQEDGVFEYLTSLGFLSISVFSFITFQISKNYWFLLFTIVFFLGFGEEINWGQRLLGFETPEFLIDSNVQKEFTLHKIELFNGQNQSGEIKSGFEKLITINFLFNLFCMGFGILLPIGSAVFKSIDNLLQKIKLPVPEIIIGITFAINWIAFRNIKNLTLKFDRPDSYYFAINEMYESGCVIIFLIIFISFWQNQRLINGKNKF